MILNASSVVQHTIQIKGGIMKRFKCECKNCWQCEKGYSWNLSVCNCENSKYLKSTADNSVIACDEITSVMDILSTKKTNAMACYYFDDIIKLEDFDIDNSLIDKKSQENIFISDI